MPKTYRITSEEAKKAREHMKKVTDKKIYRRLEVIALRGEGLTNPAIVKITQFSKGYVPKIVSEFARNGFGSLLSDNRGGNNRKVTQEDNRRVKKINSIYLDAVKRLPTTGLTGRVRLMFQDEAGFGRISKPKACWVTGKIRPSVPCHHVREYRYAYGAVEPLDGENFFIVAPRCNSDWMNVFLTNCRCVIPMITSF